MRAIRAKAIARQEARQIYRGIRKRWGKKSADRFKTALHKRQQEIAGNPRQYQKISDNPEVRKSVMSKQTSIFYEVRPDHVRILHVWDNRRNPEELGF